MTLGLPPPDPGRGPSAFTTGLKSGALARHFGSVVCVLASPDGAVLLLIDLQERLMPVIHDAEAVLARAVRLAEAAQLLMCR